MTMWSRIRSWLRAIARRSRMENEIDAELRFHIEAFAEDLVRSGVPSDEALRPASAAQDPWFYYSRSPHSRARDRRKCRNIQLHRRLVYQIVGTERRLASLKPLM